MRELIWVFDKRASKGWSADMKKAGIVGIAIVVLLVMMYVSRAQKAVKVYRLRLKWRLEEGNITRQDYENEAGKLSLGALLRNPQAVMKVD